MEIKRNGSQPSGKGPAEYFVAGGDSTKGQDSRPERIRQVADEALKRLKTDPYTIADVTVAPDHEPVAVVLVGTFSDVRFYFRLF